MLRARNSIAGARRAWGLVLAALVLAWAGPGAVRAQVPGQIVAIVHATNNETLDDDTLIKLFLGQVRTFPSGNEAVPVDQKEGSPAREEFGLRLLKRNPSQVKAYWSRQIFTGGATPPRQLEDDEAVLRFIANTPGAIGYVDATKVRQGVKVIKRISLSPQDAARVAAAGP